jgi:hypothetical protein
VTSASSSGVFLSYRREDAAPYARSLQVQLRDRFPAARVFMDLDSIEPGLEFAEVIREAVSSCAVLVALIGPQWATLADEEGRRRLDNPDDFVRFEVQTALERGVRVIPVLVEGARPLRDQQLPVELQKLARLNALELSYGRYADDANRLLDVIQRVLAALPAATYGDAADADSAKHVDANPPTLDTPVPRRIDSEPSGPNGRQAADEQNRSPDTSPAEDVATGQLGRHAGQPDTSQVVPESGPTTVRAIDQPRPSRRGAALKRLRKAKGDDSRLVSAAAEAALIESQAPAASSEQNPLKSSAPTRRKTGSHRDTGIDYQPITDRCRHLIYFLLSALLIPAVVVIPLIFIRRNRAIRMNVILALEITSFAAGGVVLTISGALFHSTIGNNNKVVLGVVLLVLGILCSAAYLANLVFCVVQIGRRRQPVIPALTRAAHWVAYGKMEAPWPVRGAPPVH